MLSLNDYLSREDSEITRQYQFINQFDKILVDLPKTLELNGHDFINVEGKKNELQINKKNQDKKLIDNESDSFLQEKMKTLINSETKIGFNKTGRIQSLKDYNKKEQYRKDLLKQIEDKKESKRRQKGLIQNEEKILENKIAQQRLTMYLEYLEEQKKDDFLMRTKMSDNGIHHHQRYNHNHQKNNHRKSVQIKDEINTNDDLNVNAEDDKIDDEIKTNVSEEIKKGMTSDKNLNILADLNEVRKIMQNDHYELLEKLLELNI